MLKILGPLIMLAIIAVGVLMYRGAMSLLRRSERREHADGAGKDGLTCPRCDSPSLERVPSDGVSPHPGYVCQECGLRMRPRGSTLLYAVMLPLSLAVLALFTAGLWNELWPENPPPGPREIRVPVGVMAAAAAVAGYSVWQLLRPTPQRSGEPRRMA